MTLTWPAGGLNKALAYQQQPPYTTPDAQNVRTFETYERRARGGSRSGLKTVIAAHTDMDGLTRWIGTVGWIDSGVRKEALVLIGGGRSGAVGRDLFYSLNGTSFSTVQNAVVAATDQIFATEKLQKLYIADPGASGDAQVRVWDPSSPTTVADNTTTCGTTPDDCPLVGLWHDRIVLAGPDQNYYMARICTPTDWSYGCALDDPARAVAGTSSDAARLKDPITALVPLTRMHLLFGGTNSLFALRGDPAFGGQFDAISEDIGIVSGAAWCRIPEGLIVFLSRDGVYVLPPGATSPPEPVSRDPLPDDLRGISATDHISMGYSIDEAGIHISRTPATGLGEHWFFDWRTKTFWKDFLPAEAQPACYAQYAADLSAQRELLLGCRGGHVLKFDEDTGTDQNGAGSTESICSYVILGPVLLAGSDYYRSVIQEIYGVLDESSGHVSWELLVGEQAEQALSAGAFTKGVWSAGRNASEHPRAAGAAVALKLTAKSRWAMENVTLRVARAGRALVA